ncbi:MAG: hypothetical protein ABIP41_05370 [Croceibacterium sp.]
MPNRKQDAAREFRRMMVWIVIVAILMVVAALSYEASEGVLGAAMAIATIFGVFFAMLLGAGLFALAFFSDKSGHDETVTRATQRQDEPDE